MIGSQRNSVHENPGLHADDYHHIRLNLPTVKFSLQCRIRAISEDIKKLFPTGVDRFLDLGSADGLLAQGINTLVPGISHIFALDMDSELLEYNPFPSVQADCSHLPFAENSFTVITAAALIEHVPAPESFLKECYRILKPGGAIFLTCPAPFFEWLAIKTGFDRISTGHRARYNLSDLKKMCIHEGFKPVISRKFMITPVYFPGHVFIESVMRKIGLSFLMLNQCAVCMK